MARTVLGQRLDKFTVARAAALALAAGVAPAAPPAAPAKLDPQPAFKTLDPAGEPIPFAFDLPAYDLATHNKLTAVAVVVLPVGHGEPVDADGWLASSNPKGHADTSALQAGGPVTVEVPGVGDGDFIAQVVLTYDA